MDFLNSLKKIKKEFVLKENIYFLILILLIFTFDRYAKLIVINNFSEQNYFVNDYINFDLIWNTGIGFGLLDTQSTLFYNFVTTLIGLVILILIYIMINSKNLDKLIYSTIIGGAIGNFYDRIAFKAVPDFIDLHYNNFHWFVFNLADVFITIGILTLIISEMLKKN
jgi:signal peptidase II|tara:strand:- start:9611 stop:10111 length:501 start_codon:yes stop_codon:yes gene_type:complete